MVLGLEETAEQDDARERPSSSVLNGKVVTTAP
jgi:hypothetical protein